jgi:hypothetical protein
MYFAICKIFFARSSGEEKRVAFERVHILSILSPECPFNKRQAIFGTLNRKAMKRSIKGTHW